MGSSESTARSVPEENGTVFEPIVLDADRIERMRRVTSANMAANMLYGSFYGSSDSEDAKEKPSNDIKMSKIISALKTAIDSEPNLIPFVIDVQVLDDEKSINNLPEECHICCDDIHHHIWMGYCKNSICARCYLAWLQTLNEEKGGKGNVCAMCRSECGLVGMRYFNSYESDFVEFTPKSK